MALYRVDRQISKVAAEEVDAAAYRSVSCLPQFEGLAWIRSFYDPESGQMTCYYEAVRADDIRRHAEMAHIPCDAVTEVTEVLPSSYR